MLVVLTLLVLVALSGCAKEWERAAEVRGSCPDPIAGFEELVDEQASESTLFGGHSVRRLGPGRQTRSESRFACEIVVVDAENWQLATQVVAEYYLDEAEALLGLRYSEISEFDEAVGSVDRGFGERIEGTYLGTRHRDECIIIRVRWSSSMAVERAPIPEDRDALVREAFADLADLCQT